MTSRIEIRLAIAAGLIISVLGIQACSPAHEEDLMAVRSDDCAICHDPEYQSAQSPPHVGIFPNECALCHSNVSWQPAAFEHANVADRLCALCHQSDYDGVTMPLHRGVFPTTCENCHGTVAWKPALDGVHPENAFPIANGAHKKFDCTDCHDLQRGSSTNGENTDCIGCHTGEHNMNKVNDQHKEVADYDYDINTPNFCLLCHPNGQN